MINTKITIDGSTYKTQVEMDVERTMSGDNATSKFWATFRNDNGQYDDEFSLNDEVIIYADKNTDPAVTKIFTGIIENIKFTGYLMKNELK